MVKKDLTRCKTNENGFDNDGTTNKFPLKEVLSLIRDTNMKLVTFESGGRA